LVQSQETERVIALTVPGAPRTKKTHNRIILVKSRGRKPRRVVMPSEQWEAWAKVATLGIAGQLRKLAVGICPLPDRAYNCAAIFYRDANRGDAVGFFQGLADVLERAGVVSNDKWIVSWDGSRLFVDRKNPRVELTLSEVDYAA
jgi:Holliday junction resolvase RusA-like endonuclease